MSTSTSPKLKNLGRYLSQTFKGKQLQIEEEYTHHDDEAARTSANERILPLPPRTNIFIWFSAIACSIFAVMVILTGLIVLLGFLIFHPRLPSFTVKDATLNTLQLSNAFVLSSDTTVLLAIHNPNSKVTVYYESLRFELQFEKHAISNVTFQPYWQRPKNATEWLFVMAARGVQLQPIEAEHLSYDIQQNNIAYDFVGTVRTKAKFQSITSIRYLLHIKCNLEFYARPIGNGTLIHSQCTSWK